MVRSQIISKVQKCQQSQTLLMTQGREVLRKCHPGSIVFILSQTKYRDCEICKRSENTRAPCRRCNGEAVPRAEKFGDLITAKIVDRPENSQAVISSALRLQPPHERPNGEYNMEPRAYLLRWRARNKVEEGGDFTEQYLITDFERRLALHRYTSRNHRHRAVVALQSTYRVTATG